MFAEARLQSACCDLFADVVRTTGSGRLLVTGCSMLPAIQPGDLLIVQRQAMEKLQPGQIALYVREGKLTAHRVAKVGVDYLVTRGDSLPAFDSPIRFSEVIGRVQSIQRNGRTVSPRFSVWKRMISAMLRRSELCLAVYLRMRSRILYLRAPAVPSQLRAQ